MSELLKGIIYSALAGASTGLGALPFLFFRKGASEKFINGSLGFAAGVMLAASAFSLVIPSMELGGPLRFVIGFLIGGLIVDLIDKIVPHEHFMKGHEGIETRRLKAIWLFVIAITIHNFPEGMAVGVGGYTPHALSIAVAIGIQNIPEGAAVAASLINAGYKPLKAFLVSFLTGLVEIFGGATGAILSGISSKLMPYLMATAAGAMIFVISDEVIPETHLRGRERMVTYWILTGFSCMAVLDLILG
ncbi:MULTISPECIES: ZIP family metal transporter [Pseudothermotoga]|jgi:ZIP family zinc transporter|uniref:Zinc/iron permease n=1 Tax=Pseudothermotoga lettingae (strain ATCC BAA-301 / DSM 14385 / NBRC 107922 / TMO) TaxID=416591 RepID=A8F546_PSELT|nr:MULTISPECIES: ZIP family metal transporter [Pseudothermotoga]ABV33280.1 zinc/iron permease [Pseudothermotoga lettingae TMO]MDI3493926.1 zinc transporter, family [Pseudothermotoga sp.]MDK2884548.1 zinc transporter, family [Pseudothermotoga sp.]GLI49803.1 ZIP family metal transporter [Pseudothermotoga lettingae TMO]HBJ80611.1 ZIP family metal transporter [Pseudothermotoga sp.]